MDDQVSNAFVKAMAEAVASARDQEAVALSMQMTIGLLAILARRGVATAEDIQGLSAQLVTFAESLPEDRLFRELIISSAKKLPSLIIPTTAVN